MTLKKSKNLINKLDINYLLLTMGEKGIFLFEKNNQSFEKSKNFEAEVSDVTGAGDTVIIICVNYLQTKDKFLLLMFLLRQHQYQSASMVLILFHIMKYSKKKNEDNLFQSIENLN